MKTIAATLAIMLMMGPANHLRQGYGGQEAGHDVRAANDVLAAAELPDSAIATSVEKQGGQVVRDQKGNIVELSLARTWAVDADVEQIARISTLKKLDLSLTYVSDAGAEHIARLKQLEELNLFAAEFITDAAVASLRANRNLRVLNLRGTDVTDTSLEYIGTLTNLRSLDISFTQITDVGMEHLAPLSALEELNLGGNKISGVGLHVLKYLPKLRKLSFYGIQRRNAGYCWAPVMTDVELDTIALLDGIEELNLSTGVALGASRPQSLGAAPEESECRIIGGSRVTDLGVAKLAHLKRLRHLDLGGSFVTGAVLKILAAFPSLERVSLWNVKGLNDNAASGFQSLRTMTSLDLSNTGIGDQTLTALAKLPNLQRLYVSDTAVTAEGLAAFKTQRPSTVVSWAIRPEPKEPLVGTTTSKSGSSE